MAFDNSFIQQFHCFHSSPWSSIQQDMDFRKDILTHPLHLVCVTIFFCLILCFLGIPRKNFGLIETFLKTCVVFVFKYCCNNFVDKMAIFHVDGKLELTISIDEFKTTIVCEQCLCAMFGFQCGSLYISKDVAYDSNIVCSTLY
jgi:hypothetical protein